VLVQRLSSHLFIRNRWRGGHPRNARGSLPICLKPFSSSGYVAKELTSGLACP